ncbi:acyltransferase family protein [Bacillus shivajii]|uniref:acyltransferase family protein n=1 Tax=Bacillus shivajii TaxID=1983719 RepID=UPI001CFA591D|nr:acyltransferase family protein [Bacillus shivajii]UCZ55171.1 acyltransferase family protein [Bacillus shivajii]
MIKEVFLLRSIACLCIVFLHAIGTGLSSIPDTAISTFTYNLFDSVNVLLYFGTPLFIFISELIIAYSYRNKQIPSHFLNKRFKYIFIPFLFMAMFYAVPHVRSIPDVGYEFFLNALIGDFHGYFVLIIFQFYFVHLLFYRFLKKQNPLKVILASLAVNIAYLSLFNFTAPPNLPYAEYIWTRFYWVPFLGWIFYFTLGFYCGYYYEAFVSLLKRYRKLILTAPIISSALLLSLYHTDLLVVHSSKRVDMIFHTTAVIFSMMYLTMKLRHIPDFLIRISQYSFGIYLLHMFYISVIDFVYQYYPVTLGFNYILILFAFSTFFSITTIYYLNKWKYGYLIVGKLGVAYKNNNYVKEWQVSEEKGVNYSS